MIGGAVLAAALLALTGAAPGSSELNPRWSPSGRYLSIERDDGTSRTVEIYAADGRLSPGRLSSGGAAPGRLVETLALRPVGGGGGFLLEAAAPAVPTFNAWLSWAPDERRFAFVSNGGEGAYDLYLGELGGSDRPPPTAAASVTPTAAAARACGSGEAVSPPLRGGECVAARTTGRGGSDGAAAAASVTRLTADAAADGQVTWSPAGDRVAFVSGRTDRGDLYLLDLGSRRVVRLTADGRSVLHPEWSPDGRRIAFALGDGDNHDICIIYDVDRPSATQGCIVSWPFDDVRPRWSPDGRRVAFYSSYNAEGEPGVWSLFTVAADGSEPGRGEGLLARQLDTGVVVDLDVGPAWTPDSRRLVYAKRVDREFNPLYVAEVATGATRRLETGHAIHHDVAIARDGRLAVRAQLARWDRVLVGRLDDLLATASGAGLAPAGRASAAQTPGVGR
jgi:Tol biopolymer transport system component